MKLAINHQVQHHPQADGELLLQQSATMSQSNSKPETTLVLSPSSLGNDSSSSSSIMEHAMSTKGEHLKQSSYKIRMNKATQFLCQMIAEPPQVEFSWFLSNNFTTKRLLAQGSSTLMTSSSSSSFQQQQQQHHQDPADKQRQTTAAATTTASSSTASGDSGAPAAAAAAPAATHHRAVIEARYSVVGSNLAESRLLWMPASHLDYGQIFCRAKNEHSNNEQETTPTTTTTKMTNGLSMQSQCEISIEPANGAVVETGKFSSV